MEQFPRRLYGAELRREFIDLGYEFFRDRNKLETVFLVGDVFDEHRVMSSAHSRTR